MNFLLQGLSFIFLLSSTFYTLIFVVFSWMHDKGWYKWTALSLQISVIAAWVAWIKWVFYV